METQHEVNDSGMKALEGYFYNLAATAVHEKYVLQQLVLNNTKLATSNESLVYLVKKLTGDINNLERDNSRLKKGGQVSGRSTSLCQHRKKEGYHQPETFYELARNKNKPPPWLEKLVMTAWNIQHTKELE